jgi:hypothetical protein
MKKLKTLITVIAVGLIACLTFPTLYGQNKYLQEIDGKAPPNKLTKKEKKLGWELLFDGKTFTNWKGYNMGKVPDCWVIEDGALKILTGGKGESHLGLITDKEYESFALSLEFKLTKGANSGIIFQVAEDEKYKYPYETGPEYQVIDHNNWHGPLKDWQICGANYAMYPPRVKDYKPVGEWNQVLLIVEGNKVTQILNGNVVVEYEKYSDEWQKLRNSGKWAKFPDYGKYDKGHIALQNHGSLVYYRDIKIKVLN